MPREPEDWAVDVVPVSLVPGEEFHFRLTNFPTGRSQPLGRHIGQLPVIYPTLRNSGITCILTGHASARNQSGSTALIQMLSDARCGAVRDEILTNVPGAVINFHGEGDAAARNELRLGVVTPNSGFHRAVSVKVVKGASPPPPPVRPKENLPFLIGIGSSIKISGLGVPAIPGGTGKQAAEALLKRVPQQFRKLIQEVAKQLGKEMKDEFDLPVGLGAALVKVSGDLVIKDKTRKKEAKSKFETLAAAMTEGEVVVDATLANGGFAPFNASETNDASTFTAGGALLEFVIARIDHRSLDSVRIFNSNPQGIIRMSPARFKIPFTVSSGVVPIFLGVSDVKLTPA